MKLLVAQLVLASFLLPGCLAFVTMKSKVALANQVHEIVKEVTAKRIGPTQSLKDFTILNDPAEFEFMKHDNMAQVHDDAEGHSDVNIDALSDEHKIVQITYRFGMQAPAKTETLKQVFTVTYVLDQGESLYVHYTNGIVDGRQEISYNSPLVLSESEAKDPALQAISAFINRGIRRELTQFMDKVIQTIPSIEKLVTELNDLGSKMKELGSTLQFSKIASSRAEDPTKMTASFFDIPKELATLLQRDPYYGMIFRDQAGREQMYVDLLGQLTGGPKDDPWHNLHLYDNFVHNKETPSFAVLFDVKEARFLTFEIASSDPGLKHFGPMECLMVFYPIRQILVIRIKSAFFSFQVDVNVLTKPFVVSTLTSVLRRIEKGLFANIQLLKKQGHNYKMGDIFDRLSTDYHLEPLPETAPTQLKSDTLGSDLTCKMIVALGLKICTSSINNNFLVAGVYASRPLNEPASDDDEDPEKKAQPQVIQTGVAGQLRSIVVPQESFPPSVDIEALVNNPYLVSPALKMGVTYYMFPASSMYDLSFFVTSVLNSFIKVDDGFDLSSGRWTPHKLDVVETKVTLNPPMDGLTEALVPTEVWVPMEGLALTGFDYTPFNPTTIVSSPKCVDIIAQANHELETSLIKNGLLQNYKLVSRVQDSRLEQVWEEFGGRLLRELGRLKKDII